jgi:PAS domain S-box-containing protein
MFQHKLQELQQRFSALQRFSHGESGAVSEELPMLLAGLHTSLLELEELAARAPRAEVSNGNGSPAKHGANGAAATNGAAHTSRPARAGRHNALTATPTVMVRILHETMRCRWASRAWLDFTGYELKAMLGDAWLQHVHPDDRAHCTKQCQDAVSANQLYRLEYRMLRTNGDYGWILEIGAPRVTTRGTVAGYLGTAIEITAYKQAENHLALSYDIARVLSNVDGLAQAAAGTLQLLCERLGWDLGELWSSDAPGRELRCAALWAVPSVDPSVLCPNALTRTFPAGATAPWESGAAIWEEDIATDPLLAREPESQRLGMHGMFRLPIVVHGEIRVVVRMFSHRVRTRDAAVADLMMAIGLQIGQFLQRQPGQVQLRESEALKSAILDASLDAAITVDADARVVEFNMAAETMFGYSRSAVLGRELVRLIVPPAMRERALATFAQFRAAHSSGMLRRRFATSAMRADGSEFPAEVALNTIGIGDPPLLTIYVVDVTARLRAEQEVVVYQERLRALMTDLLLVEEQERQRLAADLHDGLSQTIALAQMKLAALRAGLKGKLEPALDEIEGLIDQTNLAARSIGFELSPPVLHDLGLEPAVQWLVENIHARYGIAIVLEDDGQPKLIEERTRIILFRSIRELLINAAKHAGARHVRVCLQCDADQVQASVEDDGVGMDSGVVEVKGSGLISIRERLAHVGGNMRIESAPGLGTKIRLSAPFVAARSTKTKVKV